MWCTGTASTSFGPNGGACVRIAMSKPEAQPDPARGVTVYYDGSCPLCTREIGLYQRSDSSETITFCDISRNAPPEGLTRDQAMARFHVATPNMGLTSGARAFIALWLSLPRWRWLGKLASLPPLPWILEMAYRAVLPIRPAFQWLARKAFRET